MYPYRRQRAETDMDVKDFWYDLPQELIAQDPLKDRASSRLLVLDKVSGDISHKHFFDIIDYLNEGDCLVLNETKVIPARLMGVKKDTGAAITVLVLWAIRPPRVQDVVGSVASPAGSLHLAVLAR